MCPLPIDSLFIGKPGIARKVEAQRRIRKNRAANTLLESVEVECRNLPVVDGHRQIWLPPYAIVESELAGRLPAIGEIHMHRVLARVLSIRKTLKERGWEAHHKICQSGTNQLAIECELSDAGKRIGLIRHSMGRTGAESDLVPSPKPAYVVIEGVGLHNEEVTPIVGRNLLTMYVAGLEN